MACKKSKREIQRENLHSTEYWIITYHVNQRWAAQWGASCKRVAFYRTTIYINSIPDTVFKLKKRTYSNENNDQFPAQNVKERVL